MAAFVRSRGVGTPLLLVFALLAGCGTSVPPTAPTSAPATGGPTASPTAPPPPPGHELYGFIPYWEIDATFLAHVTASPVERVALFSVTTATGGAVDTTKPGYKRITSAAGLAVVDAVHKRGGTVDLVFSSIGVTRNAAFFRKPAVQQVAITALVDLVVKSRLDGLALDMEQLGAAQIDAYGTFVGQLRGALAAAIPGARLTVATGAGASGASLAAAAVAAGADRVFLMGYDYRVSASEPGASAPLARADGGHDLAWSLDTYAAAGVPVQQTLLGLPLYGMSWPVLGPVVGAGSTGPGAAWIPADHAAFLAQAAATVVVDDLEGVDVYFLASDGSVGAPALPSPEPVPSASPSSSGAPAAAAPPRTWTAIYVDSPATLERKLALGEARGLAGGGFWAIGYERGLPGYTDLMARFAAAAIPPAG